MYYSYRTVTSNAQGTSAWKSMDAMQFCPRKRANAVKNAKVRNNYNNQTSIFFYLKNPNDILGCIQDGTFHESGTSWSGKDPCQVFYCKAGVITETKILCTEQCENAVAVKGQCCPSCSSEKN